MKKICPRCGVIFEVKSDPVFCSDKCKSLFQMSGIESLKGRSAVPSDRYTQRAAEGDDNTEITRPPRR